ncbi:MAG TPA: plastocyanin/azurin family copper-binding protein [Solirubrobacteraceae bacterium]|nr:plastocyanin/azurin family copper-binding protein [Solirubrobacteraceae bacterium]
MRRDSAGQATGRRGALVISALAFVAALVVLAGCGSSSSSSSSSSAAAETPTASTASTASTATETTSTATPSTPAAGESSSASTVSLEANPEGQLEYNTKSLSAKAGKVTVDFKNMSSLMHNVTVESSSGAQVGATPTFSGSSKSVTLNLKPGTYKFFCSVPGHRQAGMEGTLTVK